MDIKDMMPSPANWLETNLTLHDLIVRKIAFENPPESFLITIGRQFFSDLKLVVKLNQLNQIQMSFWDKILEIDR